MRTLRAIQILVIIIVIPCHVFSATIYMRNGETHKGRIVGETEDTFHVKIEDETYSVFFPHHEFLKSKIFTIIDDKGVLRYPKNLALVEDEAAPPVTEEEFQRMIARSQLEIMQNQAKSLHTIGTVLTIQLLLTVGAIVVVAISSS